MAYSAKVGSFNIDAAKTLGQTQAITGVGFQPKIVMFFWSGSTATGDEAAGGTLNIGFGAAIDATHRFATWGCSVDALVSNSDAVRAQDNACCVAGNIDGATLDGKLDFSSMDANGFTLVVDDQFTQAYRISYLALGGADLSNVYIGSKAMPNTPGSYNVTGVGFQPDAVIFASTDGAAASEVDNNLRWSLGMATGSSNQGVIYVQSYDAEEYGSNTKGYGYDGECVDGQGDKYRNAFTSFGADGFALNCLESDYAVYFYFICLKGGQYKVGAVTTRTDGNDIATTTPGFQPVALLFASANRALSTQDTPTATNNASIGAATSTSNRACAAVWDKDSADPSQTAHANYDTEVYANVLNDAMVGMMDIKSIDPTGFTCVMDDADPSACWVTYLAIGAAAAASLATRKTLMGVGV